MKDEDEQGSKSIDAAVIPRDGIFQLPVIRERAASSTFTSSTSTPLTDTPGSFTVSTLSLHRPTLTVATPVGSSKVQYSVENLPLEAFSIRPVCVQAIMLLPTGGGIFDFIYKGNFKKVGDIQYLVPVGRGGGDAQVYDLVNHISLLTRLASFLMFAYIDLYDYKEAALRMATNQQFTGDPAAPPNVAFLDPRLEVLIREHPAWKRAVKTDPETLKHKVVESSSDRSFVA